MSGHQFQDALFGCHPNEEAQGEPHQTPHECLHGLVSTRASQDHRSHTRQTQCTDFQRAGPTLETSSHGGQAALH
eukprot:TCALIF_09535-PA protein Name:"Protein of unknown function" AED:0.08 eAED:0.08 QI:0/0.5/0.33/1/0/0/3/3423/74